MEDTQDRYDVLCHHKRDACLAAIPNDAQSRPQVVTRGAPLGKRLKAEAVIHNLTDVVASRLRPGLVYQIHQQGFEVVARLGRKNNGSCPALFLGVSGYTGIEPLANFLGGKGALGVGFHFVIGRQDLIA